MLDHIFHLAIPSHDLDAAAFFYTNGLGCEIARRYTDRITLNFFDGQLVCHLTSSGEIEKNPKMYPRHFGVTFKNREAFLSVHTKAKESALPFFQDLFTRFEGKREEHSTFFLKDPSNNLIEFKYYLDTEMMY